VVTSPVGGRRTEPRPNPYADRPVVRLADDHGEEHSLWLLYTTL
jgi:hypothetical protein